MLAQCVIILTAGHFWLNTFVEAMNENKPGTHMLFEMWAWIFQTHSQPIRADLKGGPSSPETQKRKRPAPGEKKQLYHASESDMVINITLKQIRTLIIFLNGVQLPLEQHPSHNK